MRSGSKTNRSGPRIKGRPRGKPFANGPDPRKAPPQWKRGQSGNPAGRPKEPFTLMQVQRLAGQMTPDALEVLNQAQHEAPWATAVAAANSLLDRSVGKPTQSQEIEVKVDDDSRAFLTELVSKHIGK